MHRHRYRHIFGERFRIPIWPAQLATDGKTSILTPQWLNTSQSEPEAMASLCKDPIVLRWWRSTQMSVGETDTHTQTHTHVSFYPSMLWNRESSALTQSSRGQIKVVNGLICKHSITGDEDAPSPRRIAYKETTGRRVNRNEFPFSSCHLYFYFHLLGPRRGGRVTPVMKHGAQR